MATAEEVRPQSIQERIAALNQSHVGRIPSASSQPSAKPATKPSLPARNKSTTSTYSNHGSTVRTTSAGDRFDNHSRELLPPPTVSRPDRQQYTATASTSTEKLKRPPPLPARKTSSRSPAPPLPSRTTSFDVPVRKNSGDSSFSIASASTSSTDRSNSARSASIESTSNRIKSPAWSDASLPRVSPRNIGGDGTYIQSDSPARGRESAETSARRLPPPNSSPIPPKLPTRKQSSGPREASRTADNAAPPLPQRRLPPPVPSADDIDKIKSSSFSAQGGRETNGNSRIANGTPREQPHVDPNVPPPVPLASRPDLSKIQATKPRATPSTSAFPPVDNVCMTCRDFSGPDKHAARYPRQSLPSHDLAWLARELTGPFYSLTDKARVLFAWLHHNIAYDVDSFFGNRVQPATPESTFSTGLAVCAGYAGLFENLAKHAGLEAVVISGHGKGFGYAPLAPGASIPPFKSNHAWNAVRIDGGYWKLIDTCWGAGSVEGAGKPYNKRFAPEQFTMTNSEFTIRHYPTDKSQFYDDSGNRCMPYPTWEEYMNINPNMPNGVEPPTVFTGAESEHGIGKPTIEPASKNISVFQPGPLRFQFGLHCEHWTLEHHSKKSAPYVFFLMANGINGRNKEYIPFQYVRGSNPGGGGDLWYADVADPRVLGAPGESLLLYIVKRFADMDDARGLTPRRFMEGVGKVAMGFEGVAQWTLV